MAPVAVTRGSTDTRLLVDAGRCKQGRVLSVLGPVSGQSRQADLSAFAEKYLGCDSGLLEDRAECSLGHVPGVIRNRGVAAGCGVEPDLVRTAGLPIELKSEFFQALYDLPVSEAGKPAHVAVVPLFAARALCADNQRIVESRLDRSELHSSGTLCA